MKAFGTRNRRGWRVASHVYAATLVCALAASGCALYLPVPTAYHYPGSRRNLNAESVGGFTCGESTLADVVLQLGEPDRVDEEEQILIYSWERVHLHVLYGWALPLGEVTIEQSWEQIHSTTRSLRFHFNAGGLLQRMELSAPLSMSEVNQLSPQRD